MWSAQRWQLVPVMRQRTLCGCWTARKACWQVTTADRTPFWLCCGDWSSLLLLQHALQVRLQGSRASIVRLLCLHEYDVKWYQGWVTTRLRIDCHLILCCAADALVTVLEESLERLELMTESSGTTAWRWQTRVAAASAVMAPARAAHLCLPEHLLHKGTQLVCALLSNEAYQARVQGTRIVPMLLQAGARMQVCMPVISNQ